MAKCEFTQAAFFIYLVVLDPTTVDGARVKPTFSKNNANIESHMMPWCSPLLGLQEMSYYFDVQHTDQKCQDGACSAIELVRDNKSPRMKIHSSKQWSVTRDEQGGDLVWQTYSPATDTRTELAKQEVVEIDLPNVEEIRFVKSRKAKGKQLPAHRLEIKFKRNDVGKHNGVVQYETFELEGGRWYDEKLISQAITQFDAEDFRQIQQNATNETLTTKGARIGRWVGGAGAILVQTRFYVAATLSGLHSQTQTLIGAVVTGAVAGSVAGGTLGGIAALGWFAAGSRKIRGYEVITGSKKIFEILRCLDEFKECEKRKLLVPREKECPKA